MPNKFLGHLKHAASNILPEFEPGVPHPPAPPTAPGLHGASASNSGADSTPNPGELSDAFLAFRSITTLLGSLQNPRALKLTGTDHASLTRPVRQELRILVALATVLVRAHDVVSVVASKDEGNTKAITCTRSGSVTEPESPCTSDAKPSQTNPDDNSQSKFWSLFATRNYRKSAVKSAGPPGGGTGDVPLMEGSDVGEALDSPSSQLRKLYVRMDTSARTFDEHVEIISKLLNNSLAHRGAYTSVSLDDLKKAEVALSVFQDYVLAACTVKISNRLSNPTLSKPFIEALNRVTDFEFKDEYPKDFSDKELCKVIPRMATTLPGKIPNLLNRANEAQAAKDQSSSYKLYTADTCQEFHILLLKLLELFPHSLEELKRVVDPAQFNDRLYRASAFGNAFWSLAGSGALESHMKAIEPVLSALNKPTKSNKVQGDAGNDDEGDGGADVDLLGVQPYIIQDGQALSLWMAYRDWLRLMVGHLDAVGMLHYYVSGTYSPYSKVSIKFLPPAAVTDQQLTWKNLLRSRHFPGEDLWKEDLIKFLDETKKKGSHITSALKALNAHGQENLPNERQISKIFADLQREFKEQKKEREKDKKERDKKEKKKRNKREKKAKETIDNGGDPDVIEILKMSTSLSTGSKADRWLKLVKMIDLLEESIPGYPGFFGVLRGMEGGRGFGGAEHCEAILSSLITSGYDEWTKNAGYVLGVSKPCCPTCDELIKELSKDRNARAEAFIIRSAHNTVSACSLPTYVREETVDKLNKIFGERLKEELIKVRAEPKEGRERAKTTTSNRLSSDTVENQRPGVVLQEAEYYIDTTLKVSSTENIATTV